MDDQDRASKRRRVPDSDTTTDTRTSQRAYSPSYDDYADPFQPDASSSRARPLRRMSSREERMQHSRSTRTERMQRALRGYDPDASAEPMFGTFSPPSPPLPPRPNAETIDLTGDDSPAVGQASRPQHSGASASTARGPRFPDDRPIISEDHVNPVLPTIGDSPEVQFLSSRSLPQPHRTRRTTRADPSSRGFVTTSPLFMSPEQLDQELTITGSRPLGPSTSAINDMDGPGRLGNLLGLGHQSRFLALRHSHTHTHTHTDTYSSALNFFSHLPTGWSAGYPTTAAAAAAAVAGDIDMDISAVAFDLGIPREDTLTPAAPTYDAPSRAPRGFSRTPRDTETYQCPNCAGELCAGEGDERQQMWVARNCGHVYCGECAANRSSAKQKERAKAKLPPTVPFKKCVVEGCGISLVNAKAMAQLYL